MSQELPQQARRALEGALLMKQMLTRQCINSNSSDFAKRLDALRKTDRALDGLGNGEALVGMLTFMAALMTMEIEDTDERVDTGAALGLMLQEFLVEMAR